MAGAGGNMAGLQGANDFFSMAGQQRLRAEGQQVPPTSPLAPFPPQAVVAPPLALPSRLPWQPPLPTTLTAFYALSTAYLRIVLGRS